VPEAASVATDVPLSFWSRNWSKVFIIVGAIVLGVIGYLFYGVVQKESTITTTDDTFPTVSPIATSTRNASKSLATPTPNLGLFASYYDDNDVGGVSDPAQYSTIGTVSSGHYAGYQIVLAKIEGSTGGYDEYLFITNDFKHFTADTALRIAYSDYSATDIFSKKANLDYTNSAGTHLFHQTLFSEKVVGVDTVGLQVPPLRIDEGNFSLVQDRPVVDHVATNDSHIDASSTGYKIYTDALLNCDYGGDLGDCAYQYYVQSADGLFFSYHLASKESLSRNPDKKHPHYLETEFNPLYLASDFVDPSVTYQSYKAPLGFGGLQDIKVKADQLAPLTQTKRGQQLYAPKDSAPAFNKDRYDLMLFRRQEAAQDLNDATLATHVAKWVNGVETTVPIPSLNEYSKFHPVLFIQDPWGTWLPLTEDDYDAEYYAHWKDAPH